MSPIAWNATGESSRLLTIDYPNRLPQQGPVIYDVKVPPTSAVITDLLDTLTDGGEKLTKLHQVLFVQVHIDPTGLDEAVYAALHLIEHSVPVHLVFTPSRQCPDTRGNLYYDEQDGPDCFFLTRDGWVPQQSFLDRLTETIGRHPYLVVHDEEEAMRFTLRHKLVKDWATKTRSMQHN